jgi:hypothetical protein
MSNLWARYADDIVVGLTANVPDLVYIKDVLGGVVSDKGINVRLAASDVSSDMDMLKVSEFLVSEIRKNASDTVIVYAKTTA